MKRIFKIDLSSKIPAFTIVELMVSMVLLVTIISIGILLWTNVVKGIGKFQNDSDLYYSYVDLTTQLQQDLSKAVLINISGRTLNLANDREYNTYTFYVDSVVRENSNARVKYGIKSNAMELSYQGQSDLVNGLFIEFNVNGKPIKFHAYKPIRGRFLVNLIFEDGN
ncbi:MAG: hypothetical protein KBA50_03070 [Sedimentibacter sp.]|nr:hypothetical protein [Sedimentibacter sp.]